MEQVHQIYRGVHHHTLHYNFKFSTFLKSKKWCLSLAEEYRMGRVRPKRTKEGARLMRDKHSRKLHTEVINYCRKVYMYLPIAPITGMYVHAPLNYHSLYFTLFHPPSTALLTHSHPHSTRPLTPPLSAPLFQDLPGLRDKGSNSIYSNTQIPWWGKTSSSSSLNQHPCPCTYTRWVTMDHIYCNYTYIYHYIYYHPLGLFIIP